MPKSTTFSNQLLLEIFNATTNATLFSAAGSATLLYIALHSADPGTAAAQTTSEVNYTGGYTRIGVARTSGGWTVSSNSVSPAANIVFAQCTGGSPVTATNWTVGTALSGAGEVLWSGSISPAIAISTGVTPILTTATAVIET